MIDMPEFDVEHIRNHFPALNQTVNGFRPAYLDNPAGTQVPQSVLDAITDYLIRANSNTHGQFHTSHLTDQTISAARAAMADLLNAPSPDNIVFGPNMTTLTFNLSRAISQTLNAGDEIIVTTMDHDANIAPWMLIARDYDFSLKWTNFDVETGRLDYEHMASLLTEKTKLVACVYASNALGTINDISRVAALAHEAGAMTFIDAVQYAPHGPIDVQALDVDFLACSAYKFFGPHMGILYGKSKHLENLPAYKVRPASDLAPDRWETGTKNHEGMAGTTAAVEYLAYVGETFGSPSDAGTLKGRRGLIRQGMEAIKRYEQTLSQELLAGLTSLSGVEARGITDADALPERVPTVIFRAEGHAPANIARALGEQFIYVWDGNYYALAVMDRLGYENDGGMVRVGPVHYNTSQEISHFLNVLEDIL